MYKKFFQVESVLISDIKSEFDLTLVGPDLLGRVARRLDAFFIENVSITDNQLETLFKSISESSSRLSRLSFPYGTSVHSQR